MLHYIAEDPWPLGLGLILVALIALGLLRATGRGKFLFVALGAGLLAAALFAVERLWVTDDERIEQVVHEVARAASRGEVDAVLARIAPDVTLEDGGEVRARGEAARGTIRATLESTRFDFIRVSDMRPQANTRNRAGKADFRVHTAGTTQGPYAELNFLTDAEGTDWSFGFEEVTPGDWRITRITAVRLPRGARLPLVSPGR